MLWGGGAYTAANDTAIYEDTFIDIFRRLYGSWAKTYFEYISFYKQAMQELYTPYASVYRHKLYVQYLCSETNVCLLLHIKMKFTLKVIWVVPCENVFRAYADSEGQDHPVHPHSLVKAFVAR